jgi:hypothetical protein
MVENIAITNNDKEEQNITIEIAEDGRFRTFQLYLSLAP